MNPRTMAAAFIWAAALFIWVDALAPGSPVAALLKPPTPTPTQTR